MANAEHQLNSTADACERFTLLYDQLKTIRLGLMDGGFKALAAIMLAVGWVATSEPARAVLAASTPVRTLTIFAGLAYALVLILGLTRASRASIQVAALLDSLAYMPRSYYVNLVITSRTAGIYSAVNLLLSVAFIANVMHTAG
jgi:hypothetical protein